MSETHVRDVCEIRNTRKSCKLKAAYMSKLMEELMLKLKMQVQACRLAEA